MATAGPNSPSAASGWTNSSNVYSSNDTYATYSIAADSNSAVLKAQGYGFAIPSGATINGVTVVAEVKASAAGLIRMIHLYLLDTSGNATGTDKTDYSYWTTSDVNHSCGSSSDLWGCALTDTWINNSNFGVSFQAYNGDGAVSRTAYVDYISITVDYTVASGQPMQARSRLVPFVHKSQVGW